MRFLALAVISLLGAATSDAALNRLDITFNNGVGEMLTPALLPLEGEMDTLA